MGIIIRPEHADEILDAFPRGPGERLHALLSGDFIFCDLLTRLIDREGPPISATISTLSLSGKNCEALALVLKKKPFPLHLIVSDFFRTMNPLIFGTIQNLLDEPFETVRLSNGRTHAKVAIFDYGERCFVIEGSANLRSSNNLEQVFVVDDREVYEFHKAWMEELAALPDK